MIEAVMRAKPRIDDPKELDRVVRRMVERFDPIAVYLFGSRARGDVDDDSDYDLMLVLADDNSRVRSRQAVWEVARSDRIDVNPFLSRSGAFAWRRHEVGTLEYEVQVDGIRLHPAAGMDLRADLPQSSGHRSMSPKVVAEWLTRVERGLIMARKACEGDDAVPDQGAYHIQQAAEKLTKAALVANRVRPRKGHKIGELANRLPTAFPHRERFLALERFTKFVWLYRYPDESGAPAEPEPATSEVQAWIAETEVLKAEFERWLAARGATP